MFFRWLFGGENLESGHEAFAWDSQNVSGYLEKIRAHVEEEATSATRWYFSSKNSKALWSRWLRLLAILLTSVAGLLPLVATLLERGIPGISQLQWGLIVSLLLGTSAGLLAFDHYFGFSSGWIRYVLTATGIQNALAEFRMDWQCLNANTSAPPTMEQILALIQRARAFLISVRGMVLDETKTWATEFQNNLAQLEKEVKAQYQEQRAKVEEQVNAQAAAAMPGAVEITVSNALVMDERTFTIGFEHATAKTPVETVVRATHWSKIGMAPGQYSMTVKAKKNGRRCRAPAFSTWNPERWLPRRSNCRSRLNPLDMPQPAFQGGIQSPFCRRAPRRGT
jgi:hypothetical protein